MYDEYTNFVSSVLEHGDLTGFKRDPHYTGMLEHVSESQGNEYLKYIIKKFGTEKNDIINFCQMNDLVGNPETSNYLDTQISPSSLRYFLHAMLILTHFNSKKVSPLRIVEVGGGYGGLCLAINYCLKFFPELGISEYIIIDLNHPSKLQAIYLSKFQLSFPCTFLDAKNFGAEVENDGHDLFLISNYCFSEISFDLQDKYQSILFPKVKHGFLTWNNPLRSFGKVMEIEEEYPKTGPWNLYIRF